MLEAVMTNVFCPFMGSVAFALLFGVPKRFYLSGGITGAIGWLVYCFTVNSTSTTVATFIGTVVVVLISRLLTVRMKCPITVFLIVGIFPLIPGGRVYYTIYYVVTEELNQAVQSGLGALKIAFAIVLGIAVMVSIPREYFQFDYWRQRRLGKG